MTFLPLSLFLLLYVRMSVVGLKKDRRRRCRNGPPSCNNTDPLLLLLPLPELFFFFLAAASAVGAKFKSGSRQSIPHNVVHIFLLFVSPNDIPLKGMHTCVVQRRI